MATFNPASVSLIGLSGKMGAGKDETASILLDLFARQGERSIESTWERHAFADQLKRTVATMVRADLGAFYTETGKNVRYPIWANKSGRELLQEIGTHMRVSYGADVWVDTTLQGFTGDQRWIISDVRFKTEADRIKALGGIVIRLDGDPSGLRAGKSSSQLQHVSETDLDDYQGFDAVIDNSQVGLPYLQAKLARLFGL